MLLNKNNDFMTTYEQGLILAHANNHALAHDKFMECVRHANNPLTSIYLAKSMADNAVYLEESIQLKALDYLLESYDNFNSSKAILEADGSDIAEQAENIKQTALKWHADRGWAGMAVDTGSAMLPSPKLILQSVSALASVLINYGVSSTDTAKNISIIYKEFDLVEFITVVWLFTIVLQMIAPTGASQASAIAQIAGRAVAKKTLVKLAQSSTIASLKAMGKWNVVKISARAGGAAMRGIIPATRLASFSNPRNWFNKTRGTLNSFFRSRNKGYMRADNGVSPLGGKWYDDFDNAVASGDYRKAFGIVKMFEKRNDGSGAMTAAMDSVNNATRNELALQMGAGALPVLGASGIPWQKRLASVTVRAIAESADPIKYIWSCAIVGLASVQMSPLRVLIAGGGALFDGNDKTSVAEEMLKSFAQPMIDIGEYIWGTKGGLMEQTFDSYVEQCVAEEQALEYMIEQSKKTKSDAPKNVTTKDAPQSTSSSSQKTVSSSSQPTQTRQSYNTIVSDIDKELENAFK